MMTKILIRISGLTLAAMMLAGCSQQAATVADPIGIDAAKTVALEDAGVNTAEVSFTSAGLDRRGDLEYYDVEFTAGGEQYSYDIDAMTGVIIERSVPVGQSSAGDPADPQPLLEAQTAVVSNTQTVTTQSGQSNASLSEELIGEAAAKAKALEHAGLTEAQVTFIKQKLDWDDGRQVYEVEFYTQDYTEYDYEIDAQSGEVLSYDYDAETWFQTPDSSGTELTAEEAKALALSKVPGAAASDIREFDTDREDGRLEYEGEIIYSNTKYEFEIDGYSGTIRSWEVEALRR